MNSEAEGLAIGPKVLCPRCKGVVKKGEAVYAWEDGVPTVQTTALVGIALDPG